MSVSLSPGLELDILDRRMVVDTGVTSEIGDIVCVDEAAIASGKATIVDVPATADLESGLFGVVIDLLDGAGAAGTEILVRFKGHVRAKTNGAIALADNLGAVNAQDYLDQTGAAAKIVAIPLETQSSGVNLTSVLFDGLAGFGTDVA